MTSQLEIYLCLARQGGLDGDMLKDEEDERVVLSVALTSPVMLTVVFSMREDESEKK